MPGDFAIRAVRVPVGRTAQHREQILCAPHQRKRALHPGQFIDRQCAQRSFDQHHHVQRREVTNLLRFFGFREHHGCVGGSLQRVEVQLMVGRRAGVDPHDGAVGVQRGSDQRGAGSVSVLCRNAVFEIENHDICCCGCFFESFRAVGRTEQPRRSGLNESHQFSSAGLLRIMVLREAVATMSPC
jgi:hypothetical protein